MKPSFPAKLPLLVLSSIWFTTWWEREAGVRGGARTPFHSEQRRLPGLHPLLSE